MSQQSLYPYSIVDQKPGKMKRVDVIGSDEEGDFVQGGVSFDLKRNKRKKIRSSTLSKGIYQIEGVGDSSIDGGFRLSLH